MARVARLSTWFQSLGRRREPHLPAPAAAIRRSSDQQETAVEAELDTLRGELVRELDRLAADDAGSASFRRIAS